MKYTVLNCKVNFCSNCRQQKTVQSKEASHPFMVFHIGAYVFAIRVLNSGEYIVYETQPIGSELSGNGNRIIVKTFCKYELS